MVVYDLHQGHIVMGFGHVSARFDGYGRILDTVNDEGLLRERRDGRMSCGIGHKVPPQVDGCS